MALDFSGWTTVIANVLSFIGGVIAKWLHSKFGGSSGS